MSVVDIVEKHSVYIGVNGVYEKNLDATWPRTFKNPRMQPPEMIGSVRLSSRDPRSSEEEREKGWNTVHKTVK